MKTKKAKKLILNKKTISHLSMNDVRAGGATTGSANCSNYCSDRPCFTRARDCGDTATDNTCGGGCYPTGNTCPAGCYPTAFTDCGCP